jgi:hypothetical protein
VGELEVNKRQKEKRRREEVFEGEEEEGQRYCQILCSELGRSGGVLQGSIEENAAHPGIAYFFVSCMEQTVSLREDF